MSERENGGTPNDILKHPAVVKALREAFVNGSYWERFHCASEHLSEATVRRYPMPTVQVPRVVRVPTYSGPDAEYRISAGVVETRSVGADDWTSSTFSRESLAVFADLLAHPTETREVGG